MFKYNDKIEIFGTNSYLDGQQAKVVGLASQHPEFSTYILELNEKAISVCGWKCIALTESCFKLTTND